MGSLRFMMVAAVAGCAAPTAIGSRPREFHDRGLAYLELALEASEPERSRLCDQAEQTCRLAIEYDGRFAHGHNCLGLIELGCHRAPERAADHFKRALSLEEDFAEAHNNLGVTFERRMDHALAIEEFLAAIEIDPGFEDARENLARSMMHLERWKEAREHLLRLIEIRPSRVEAHHLLGVTELETRRLAEAEHQLLMCLELAPNHAECNYELGLVYLETERLDQAILVLVIAARLPSPVQLSAQQNLRIAYERIALRDGAVVALIDRCKHEPGNADCRYDLGAAFASQGLYEEATREWEEAVRLRPDQCAAHRRLAMAAHRVFDTATTERECRATIECARRTEDSSFREMAEECREIVRALE
jgi:tetratricopeptide (TPR) repeat protein